MQRIKKKNGEIAFDTIAKLVIALIILTLIIVFIFLLKDKSLALFEKIRDLLRFG